MSYVYRSFEPGLWTVGVYDPDGTFQPESDHDSTDAAADRVRFLNGGPMAPPVSATVDATVSRHAALSEVIGVLLPLSDWLQLAGWCGAHLTSDTPLAISHSIHKIGKQARGE